MAPILCPSSGHLFADKEVDKVRGKNSAFAPCPTCGKVMACSFRKGGGGWKMPNHFLPEETKTGTAKVGVFGGPGGTFNPWAKLELELAEYAKHAEILRQTLEQSYSRETKLNKDISEMKEELDRLPKLREELGRQIGATAEVIKRSEEFLALYKGMEPKTEAATE